MMRLHSTGNAVDAAYRVRARHRRADEPDKHSGQPAPQGRIAATAHGTRGCPSCPARHQQISSVRPVADQAAEMDQTAVVLLGEGERRVAGMFLHMEFPALSAGSPRSLADRSVQTSCSARSSRGSIMTCAVSRPGAVPPEPARRRRLLLAVQRCIHALGEIGPCLPIPEPAQRPPSRCRNNSRNNNASRKLVVRRRSPSQALAEDIPGAAHRLDHGCTISESILRRRLPICTSITLVGSM